MKIMFVYAGFENLGIEYLSAVLKSHGHRTSLAFDPRLFNDQFLSVGFLRRMFNYESQLVRDIIAYKPALVVFSVVSSDYAWALRISRRIKKQADVPIVFGGIHPTSVPEVVLRNECVDYVFVGEGESSLAELADSISQGKEVSRIRNLCFRKGNRIVKNPMRPLIRELDKLPFPDKELFYDVIPNYRKGYIITARRGCPNNCSYCYNSVLSKIYSTWGVRMRSPANVIEELKQAKKRYGIRNVRFNDDLFTSDENWLKEFSRMYRKEIRLPMYCSVSPDTTNEKVVRYLRDMGCYQVCMGVQSLNPVCRKEVLHRGGTNRRIAESIALYRKYRIRCVVDNILGLPGETKEDLLDMVQFYNKNRVWGRIAVFWLIYFPKTCIIDVGIKKGSIKKQIIKKISEKPEFIANTMQNSTHNKNKLKYHWLLLLVNFLPESTIDFIIKHGIYDYFPSISPSILEIPFTIFARDRYDIPRQRYAIRYMKYMLRLLRLKLFPI